MPTTSIRKLKRDVKRGPRMSRELGAEFVLTQCECPTRKLQPATLRKIAGELERLASRRSVEAQRFVKQMRQRHPEMAEIRGGA